MARAKQARTQTRSFSVPMIAQPTPESGFLFRCSCGFQWWGSDESWVGCRECHIYDPLDLEVSVMLHDEAVAAGLYCVTTGGLGLCVVDGMTWAVSIREYPPNWTRP